MTLEKLDQSTEVGSFERYPIISHLEGPNGEHNTLNVRVSRTTGELTFTNFWDLDQTLLNAERFHFAAVDQIYPEFAETPEDAKHLHEFYFTGFPLGNSVREWWRMHLICTEGQDQYKDPLVFEREFIDDPEQRKLVDQPGHVQQYYEIADSILQRYGKIAYGIMETEYNENPDGFSKRYQKPEVMDLLKKKTRMGQANVFMTANQADFAKGFVKFCGLSEYGLALATDETMIGGAKAIAIEKLIDELWTMELVVNPRQAAAIGDSLRGDVGSGTEVGLGYGILIGETSTWIAKILARAEEDTPCGRELKNILATTAVTTIATKEVKRTKSGRYLHGKKGSEKRPNE